MSRGEKERWVQPERKKEKPGCLAKTDFRKLGTWTQDGQSLAIFKNAGGGALPRRRKRAAGTHAPVLLTQSRGGVEDGGSPGGARNADPRGYRGVRGSQCKPVALSSGREKRVEQG